jgi:hypothetical protein
MSSWKEHAKGCLIQRGNIQHDEIVNRFKAAVDGRRAANLGAGVEINPDLNVR